MAGGPAGDVLVTVTVGSHPLLRRSGQDLLVDVPVTLSESVLGTTVCVSLLKGSVDVRIPPGTSSGTKLRVRGQGVGRDDEHRGDLIVVVQITVPDSMSDALRNTFQDIAAELPDPRSDISGLSTIDDKVSD